MFRYKCTIFRENKMLVLNTNHHLKAVTYLQHAGDTVRSLNETLVMQSTQTHHINSCMFVFYFLLHVSVIHIHRQVVTEYQTYRVL
jgi:hypothetical protein